MISPAFAVRFSLYVRLARLDKPIGILLLLWPTLWALWLSADGRPEWMVVAVFVLGTVLMRSAGCVINDYADRDFDKHVERTRNRPLTAGNVSTREALLLFAGLCLLAFALVLALGRPLVIWLSVPAVFLAASYPFTKRFLAIPQAVRARRQSYGVEDFEFPAGPICGEHTGVVGVAGIWATPSGSNPRALHHPLCRP